MLEFIYILNSLSYFSKSFSSSQFFFEEENILCLNKIFCNILVTCLLYSLNYNKSNQAFKVAAIMLHRLKSTFSQFFFLSHADNNSCLSRQTTSLLKPPPPYDCWIVASKGSELWIGTSNLRDVRCGICSIPPSSWSLFRVVRYEVLQCLVSGRPLFDNQCRVFLPYNGIRSAGLHQ